ncbi:MAG: OmpA family protein [Pseudomonadota bacterium]
MRWTSSLVARMGQALFLLIATTLGGAAQQAESDSQLVNAVSFAQGAVLLDYTSEFGNRQSPEWLALGLIDGTTELGWSSKQQAPFPHIFTFELSRLFELEAFEFDNRDSDEPEYPGISALDVQVLVSVESRDGPFVEVADAQLKAGDLTKLSLDEASPGRWIKLVVKSNGGHPEFTELMEFRAFGKPSSSGEFRSRATSGTYSTNWDMFYLQIEDGKLTGCYDHDEGVFDGSLTGQFLSIEWRETGPQIGKAVMAMTEDGSYFNGFWYEGGELRGTWHGPKVDDNRAPDCANRLKVSTRSQISQSLETSGRAVLYGLYFDFNSAVLKPESLRTLEELQIWVQENRGRILSVEGHTDSDGSDSFNLDLSQRRAQAVVEWLTTRGADPGTFNALGRGESTPVADNSTAQGKALNRRVEVHLRN